MIRIFKAALFNSLITNFVLKCAQHEPQIPFVPSYVMVLFISVTCRGTSLVFPYSKAYDKPLSEPFQILH